MTVRARRATAPVLRSSGLLPLGSATARDPMFFFFNERERERRAMRWTAGDDERRSQLFCGFTYTVSSQRYNYVVAFFLYTVRGWSSKVTTIMRLLDLVGSLDAIVF